MTPEDLSKKLQQVFDQQLVSVVLYGSAAAGDYIEKRSDYNVLVVVEVLGPKQLRAFSKTAQAWAKAGNPAPLFFTRDRLKRATDIFPIELSDIRDTHKILHGEDLVSNLEIEREHLRIELERELHGKLIQLRERYLVCAEKEKEVGTLLIESLSTFLVLCRAALRLWQEDVPAKKIEAMRALKKYIGFDTTILEQLEGLKETGKLPVSSHDLFRNYLSSIEAIVRAIDAYDSKPHSKE